MLSNYLKLALRNLAKHRFFALLNITGLALGMATCLTVILIIREELSFDKFHPLADRIYRIDCQQVDGMKIATVSYPLGDALVKDYSVAESSVRLVRSIQRVDASTQSNLTLPISGYFTEPSFFKIFGFQLESGNAATALSEPNTIILSREAVGRFFGQHDPLGETLTLKGKGVFRVTGVVATPPGKTHLDFDCLVSVSTLEALEKAYPPDQALEKVLDNWENYFMTYVYVLTNPGKTKADLSKALADISEKRSKEGKTDKDLRLIAQNLDDISPKAENLANDGGSSVPWFFIWGLCAFVIILTVFPCLNYANLAIARALARTREVGVRKAIGAQSLDIKRLILTEAVVTALLALALAWVLHLPLNRLVGKWFPPEAKLDALHAQPLDWIIFIAFGILVGLLAGWLPSQKLSKLRPAMALRGNNSGEMPNTSRFGWRTMMLVGQFIVSLVFMIVVSTLWSQMRYMTLADYGFQKENLLSIELQGNKAQVVAEEMAKDPRVTGTCTCSVLLASNNLQGIPLQLARGADPVEVHCASVDRNFVPVMGLNIIAGSNFPENASEESDQYLMVNEKALKRFQLGTPGEALGRVIWMNDSTPVTICGVMRDFNYRVFEHPIEPFVLRYAPLQNRILHVRIAPGDPATTLAALTSIWKKIDGIHPFEAQFMVDSIQKAYGDITLVGGLMSFFAFLAISLACMGLLGTVTYTVSTKVKEIGIRKVLGASVAQVAFLLSGRFLVLLGVSILFAIPVGYMLSNAFLNFFTYRITVGWMILLGSTVGLLSLGLITVGIEAIRASLENPVSSLRSE